MIVHLLQLLHQLLLAMLLWAAQLHVAVLQHRLVLLLLLHDSIHA